MSDNSIGYLLYVLPLVAILFFYLRRQKKKEHHHVVQLKEALAAGLTEPASLHPVFDFNRCIGSGACVTACPEEAIGLIKGKGHLIKPAVCIGHGACRDACPHDAISLVFGTAKRGVDIPRVNPDFETNIAGIYIAGELGGMGLIRKAVEQGRQAIESIHKKKKGNAPFDVVIIGAGPAGLAASLAALEKKLRFVTLEQEDSLGGTVYHYPRNKMVMTKSMNLPLIGKVRINEISKEALLEFWLGVVKKINLKINFSERMETITKTADGFVVKSSRNTYQTKTILLSIGRRGTPRKLDVPGEDLPNVVYRLIDPEQYRNQRVLVVGGGDSALEAALAIADQPGTAVTLSYRGDAFGRVKEKNRQRLQETEKKGRLKVLLQSNVKKIERDKIVLDCTGKTIEIKNDSVIISAGGVLPTPLLKEIGVMVETKYGTA
ncbi:MAG: NAD(P)-binding domain-containing protein [Gammaproteobacteria bacterium]|nr:NAD(P)-binding domain-containing protein [Gammaproteobacteria bacterium]